MLAPDHRFHAVIVALTRPEDPQLGALYDVLHDQATDLPAVADAYALYTTESHRSVIDAFILARTPLSVVSQTLEIPTDVLEAYMYLFMDTSAFRNKLERMSYAVNYPGDAYGKELMRAGVMVGYEYLLWTFGHPDYEMDGRQIVRRTMVDAFYRGMAHRGNAVTSATAQNALKWWQQSIRNAETLERIDPRASKHATEELRIALESKDETRPIETLNIDPAEILH